MTPSDTHPETAPWPAIATLPLTFAQVREDPRLDVEVTRRIDRPATVVMIASGGETAVSLGRLALRSLTVVDINAAQLGLTRMKWHLARNHPPRESMALLGHAEMEPAERKARLAELLSKLDLNDSVFGPLDQIAALGPDCAGRYERLFAELRRALSPHAQTIARILNTHDPVEAVRSVASGTVFGDALDASLAEVMSLANLECLFGNAATRNPRQPFCQHFAERIRQAVATLPAPTNPFLWQLLVGTFAPATSYDWLDGGAAPLGRLQFRLGKMDEVLAAMEAESADVVHLSNILDWLPPNEATLCLNNAARVLRSGGCVIVRQLNSTLDIPSLSSRLQWEETFGRELHAKDRSFFYTAIHIGRKP
jgi:S-adenosylmethionine-diacylglycerol 3-amino-3-carboxypropyl transferase